MSFEVSRILIAIFFQSFLHFSLKIFSLFNFISENDENIYDGHQNVSGHGEGPGANVSGHGVCGEKAIQLDEDEKEIIQDIVDGVGVHFHFTDFCFEELLRGHHGPLSLYTRAHDALGDEAFLLVISFLVISFLVFW